MAVSFLFFSSDAAWQLFNDNSGTVAVSIVTRGADNLLTGTDYELLLQDSAGADQDEANFQWADAGDADYTLSWDASTSTLTFTVTNAGVPVTESVSWVIPTDQVWSVLSIRASVLNAAEAKSSRIRTLSTDFESDMLGAYEIDLDGPSIAGSGTSVNVVAIVASDNELNNDWTLTGTLRFDWGATYPDANNMTLTFGLSNPAGQRTSADNACLSEEPGSPPTCQQAIGDACFRYEYDCVGGEWVLDFAECVDNSLCAAEQSTNCTDTKFEFEERNTCFDGGTVPTPTTPDLTNSCYCVSAS